MMVNGQLRFLLLSYICPMPEPQKHLSGLQRKPSSRDDERAILLSRASPFWFAFHTCVHFSSILTLLGRGEANPPRR